VGSLRGKILTSGFYMDGYYFGILLAKTMPRLTIAKTMEPFMDLTMPNTSGRAEHGTLSRSRKRYYSKKIATISSRPIWIRPRPLRAAKSISNA